VNVKNVRDKSRIASDGLFHVRRRQTTCHQMKSACAR